MAKSLISLMKLEFAIHTDDCFLMREWSLSQVYVVKRYGTNRPDRSGPPFDSNQYQKGWLYCGQLRTSLYSEELHQLLSYVES